ncbi:hypothetical protein [Streptomyces sp. NPDC017673]|uniref:hypothetical protein n=1 Tax=unclassified Streptomyces TaxID=2593676 RepID=UPI0037B2A096
MRLSMETVRAVLGVAEDIRLGLVLERAGRREHRLGGTVCSLAAVEGARLGRLGEALLAAEHARRAEYGRLADLARGCGRAEVLKGAALERLYPEGVLRSSRDVDLLMPDEDAMWRAVAAVAASRPVDEARVSMIESPGRRDWAVALNWPSPESDLDHPYAVEFFTAAFVGDHATVPLRPGRPDDPLLAGLLLIAEELFQQPPRGRDLVDTALLLAAVPEAERGALHRAARDWSLAPELHQLAERVCDIPLLSTPAARWAADALVDEAERERARRAAEASASGGGGTKVRYGLFLGEALRAFPARVEESPGLTVLRCPVGGFLLVDDVLVPQELADAALARYPQAVLPA